MSGVDRAISVGDRVVVTGVAGAGKSTFSRALSTRTGLPVIHLDVHFWKPGWVATPETEWRQEQRELLCGDNWIVDGNDDTLDVRLERADTVVLLDTPRRTCVWRALVRGVRPRPAGFELPRGCDESAWRRLRDEWSLAWRIWKTHGLEVQRDLALLSRCREEVAVHVLRSKRELREFLDGLGAA